MSDHLPLRIQVDTDTDAEELDRCLAEAGGGAGRPVGEEERR
jgi:hypothetical protein